MDNLFISVKSVINRVCFQRLGVIKLTPDDFIQLSDDEKLVYYRKIFDSVLSARNALSALDDLLVLLDEENYE